MRYKYWLALGASMVVGLVFMASGVGKLLGQNAFLLAISSPMVMPGILARIVATWLPWAELVLGVSLVTGVLSQLAALFSAVLAGALILHNSWMISLGLGYEPCACLGVFERVFQGRLSTTGALFVDIGLFVLALVVYFFRPGKFINLRPWYWRQARVPEASNGNLAPPTGPAQQSQG